MNPDECKANNPRWRMNRGSKGSASTPFEVSQMHSNNPCLTCQVYKHCKHEVGPFRHPIKNVKYVQIQHGHPPKVKGELINAKRQVGLSSAPHLDKEGQPTFTKHGKPRRDIVRIVYGRTIDMWQPHETYLTPPDTAGILSPAEKRWSNLKGASK